jgi:cytochrome P450
MLSHRYVREDVTLSDGTTLPKGSIVGTNMSRMWDPEFCPEPHTWQPNRFLKQRSQPGQEQSAQFVTTTMESLGFGIGSNACCGRFFASNKIRILLAFVIEDYEFEKVDTSKSSFPHFLELITNP